MVFPQKGSFFFIVSEQLRSGTNIGDTVSIVVLHSPLNGYNGGREAVKRPKNARARAFNRSSHVDFLLKLASAAHQKIWDAVCLSNLL